MNVYGARQPGFAAPTVDAAEAQAEAGFTGRSCVLTRPVHQDRTTAWAVLVAAPSAPRSGRSALRIDNGSAAARTLRQALRSPETKNRHAMTLLTRLLTEPRALRLPPRRESIGPLRDTPSVVDEGLLEATSMRGSHRAQGSILRSFVLACAIALLSGGVSGAAAQTRSDTLAVIATVLERAKGAEAGLFVPDDAPALVLEAVQLLPTGFVRPTGGALTFCSDEVATDGDNIGVVASISLEPGDGPRSEPPPRRDPLTPTPPGPPPVDYRLESIEVDIWSPAFYMDTQLAYVSVSRGCYLRPMGGLINIELADGRRVSASSSGATYELRRQGQEWVITRTFNSWIT